MEPRENSDFSRCGIQAVAIIVVSLVPTRQQVDALLRFLPAFKRQGFWFERVIWESGQASTVEKSPEAEMFVRTLRDNQWILPTGGSPWQGEADDWVGASARLCSADLADLQRLFTSWIERDRLLPGHLGALFERGDLTTALERLQVVRDRAPERPEERTADAVGRFAT